MTEKHHCSARVWSQGAFFSSPCARSGSLFEEGKHWCKTHAPSSVKARRDASRAKWDFSEIYAAKRHNEWHKNAEGQKAIELLREIAAGNHGNQSIEKANEFIEQYEKGLKNV